MANKTDGVLIHRALVSVRLLAKCWVTRYIAVCGENIPGVCTFLGVCTNNSKYVEFHEAYLMYALHC
jgi:hypothetical protein